MSGLMWLSSVRVRSCSGKSVRAATGAASSHGLATVYSGNKKGAARCRPLVGRGLFVVGVFGRLDGCRVEGVRESLRLCGCHPLRDTHKLRGRYEEGSLEIGGLFGVEFDHGFMPQKVLLRHHRIDGLCRFGSGATERDDRAFGRSVLGIISIQD